MPGLAEELAALRKQVKVQEKEIWRLKDENEFLAEASAFFAASRRKSAKNSEGGLSREDGRRREERQAIPVLPDAGGEGLLPVFGGRHVGNPQ